MYTYTNSTVESRLVGVCVMPKDWIVGPFLRLIRRVRNYEMFKENNWIVGISRVIE